MNAERNWVRFCEFPNLISVSTATSALVAAYALIREPKVRRPVVARVEQIVAEPDSTVH
jgi:hypothetical protein